jgi:hypothetical protein
LIQNQQLIRKWSVQSEQYLSVYLVKFKLGGI